MKTGLSAKEIELLRAAYMQENENRSSAITWVCRIEKSLQLLLRTAMIDDPEIDTLFDDSNGPLATFAAQIKCAWAMGLIDSELRKDLDCIRKVRNKFAHDEKQAGFSSSPVREWLQQMSPVRNGAVTLKEFSPCEYDNVVTEIQCALLALVLHKCGIDQSVGGIKAVLRAVIEKTVEDIVPPDVTSKLTDETA